MQQKLHIWRKLDDDPRRRRSRIVLTLSWVIVEYAYNMHQVFRREANDVRFALPCKCASNNLFKCNSVTILWMRMYNIYVLYVFDTLPQQLIENHIKNRKHPQIIPNIFRHR